MSLSSVRSILLSTALAITSVQASPFDLSATLQARDLVGSSCVPFVYGAKNTPGGEVCTSISGNNLIVNYPDLSGGSYSDLHVIVQTGAVTEPNQGKWPYTLGKGQCTTSAGTASCTIPILDAWRKCSAPLYVGVHASFNTGAGASETGWGNGQCISDRSNCPKYFTFTPKCECTTVTSYEPYSTSVSHPSYVNPSTKEGLC
jgi:hypothetical protein